MAFVENARQAFAGLPDEPDFPSGPYDWMADEPLDDVALDPAGGLAEGEPA
jgi:hypothetical protein